jgi:four helix bundle protein
MAQGSLEESRYYLILATDLQIANLANLETQAAECSKMIEAYSQTLRRALV